ncbi:MAG TPA: PEP-CTERM sorting domain-containing protein [Verrucomicrobiae bacterium]|nr:PEP-CTERM sorting domain-containing protein [Verrucomicrobiae bacterium]
MKISIIRHLASAALIATVQCCYSQEFINLNFESANIPNGTSAGSNIPIGDGLPGWTALFSSGAGTDQTTQVVYDGISLGGYQISIIDSNAPVFNPIQGNYSAFLFGGGEASPVSATISQTGLVPSGTESILFDAYESEASFIVSLGGQTLNVTPLQTFSHYTLYGGNIPASLAGEVETLSFTEPPATGGPPSFFELDNIQFSSSPVPEPGTLALCALGCLSLVCRWRRKSSA